MAAAVKAAAVDGGGGDGGTAGGGGWEAAATEEAATATFETGGDGGGIIPAAADSDGTTPGRLAANAAVEGDWRWVAERGSSARRGGSGHSGTKAELVARLVGGDGGGVRDLGDVGGGRRWRRRRWWWRRWRWRPQAARRGRRRSKSGWRWRRLVAGSAVAGSGGGGLGGGKKRAVAKEAVEIGGGGDGGRGLGGGEGLGSPPMAAVGSPAAPDFAPVPEAVQGDDDGGGELAGSGRPRGRRRRGGAEYQGPQPRPGGRS